MSSKNKQGDGNDVWDNEPFGPWRQGDDEAPASRMTPEQRREAARKSAEMMKAIEEEEQAQQPPAAPGAP